MNDTTKFAELFAGDAPQARQTATDAAISRLVNLIRSGKIGPGDRLPPQRQLTGMLGMSYSIIREALRGLASMGLVEILHGQGVFVKSVAPEMLIEPEALFFLLEKESLRQAIEVRRILEVEGIAMAAERATGQDLDRLRQTLAAMKIAAADPRPLAHSPEFHLALAEASHNQVLVHLMKSFIRLIDQASSRIARSVPESVGMEYPQHYALYEGVVQRNPGEARRRMRAHIHEAEAQLMKSLNAEKK